MVAMAVYLVSKVVRSPVPFKYRPCTAKDRKLPDACRTVLLVPFGATISLKPTSSNSVGRAVLACVTIDIKVSNQKAGKAVQYFVCDSRKAPHKEGYDL